MGVLICQEEGGAAFKVLPEPTVTPGFREYGRYVFTLDHPDPCMFVIDDVPLACESIHGRQRWEWMPGFYAGTVVAELFDEHGIRIMGFRLDVAPDPTKLGQEVFQCLIDELQANEPELLFGTEAAQHTIGAGGYFSNVHLAYARLQRYGPQFLLAMKDVSSRPLTVLRSERQLVRAHRARRVDARTLSRIVRNPLALAALGGNDPHDRSRYDVPTSREDFDTPAHRILLAVTLALIRRVRAIQEAWATIGQRDQRAQARTALAPRLPLRMKRLGQFEASLKTLLRARPLCDTARAEVSSAGLNVISGHPAYSRAFRIGWQILRPGIEGMHTGDLMPVSPTWEVYERWCFLRVIDALKRRYPDLIWTRQNGGKPDRILFTGQGSEMQVRAQLQAKFPAADRKQGNSLFYSISAERHPDIVVSWSQGVKRKLIILDAKYRVSRENVLDAMESAHLYRDCLRWNGLRPEFAMLLVPAGGGAPGLEEQGFHLEHGVGVVPLSPATGAEGLESFLSLALA